MNLIESIIFLFVIGFVWLKLRLLNILRENQGSFFLNFKKNQGSVLQKKKNQGILKNGFNYLVIIS